MADISKILGGPWSPPVGPVALPPEVQFVDAIRKAGLEVPDKIILDGKLHRFRSGANAKKFDKSGWYVGHADGIPCLNFGCWRMDITITVRADMGDRKWTAAEEMAHISRIAAAKKQRDIELERDRGIAANDVETIWAGGAQASPDHPYLKRKGVEPHGARVTGDGRLMLPLFSPEGELASLQYIDDKDSQGEKRYHSGGQTGGMFWMLGTLDVPGVLYIAEGFATAATIHQTTNRPCVVSYSAGSLVPVTGSLREQMPNQELVIVADNDKSGIGQRYAEQASAKYGARMILIPTPGDANDYVQAGNDLLMLLVPPKSDIITKLKAVFGNELGIEYEAPDELIEGLLVMGSLTVTYGDSNSGKTFWALAMAAHIAMGREFCGRKVDSGLVIYLASEAPGSIRSRMQAMKRYYGHDLADLAMVPLPMNFYEGDEDANDVIALVQAISELKGKPVRLIVGDTLARLSAGANENSGEDMGPVMARFDRVAQATKAALHIIHHNGKDQAKGARGWSGIRAHIDTEIEVTEKDGIRSASVTKQRELPGKGEAIYFRLEVVEMGITKFGQPATTCVAVHDEQATSEQPHKKPTKHDENMRILERTWWASGTEMRNGHPYISRSALKDLLIKDGNTDRTARNKTDPSRKEGLIAQMLNAGVLSFYEHGWIFINEAQISSLLLMKNNGVNK
jgi:putative DNA primase/helicase